MRTTAIAGSLVVSVLLLSGRGAAQEASSTGGAASTPPTGSVTSAPLASVVPTNTVGVPDKQSAEQYHQQGVRMLRERHMDAAIDNLRQATALDPKSALYVTDLGYAYLIKERWGEAESAFRQGILLDPTRPHAYGHLVESVIRGPHRWEKRPELLRILEQGLSASQDQETRLKLAIARIRAERSFGLVERAREHIEASLHEPKLPRALEKQLNELEASLAQDEQAQALRDWPEPTPDPKDQQRFVDCERQSASRRAREILDCLAQLSASYPAWRAPRQLRAQLLTEEGHYDEAVKELTILTRLEPSSPLHFRRLGVLLAEHGGLLELERADEALRIAVALEPEWSELDAMRQRLATRRYDAQPRLRPTKPPSLGPSENSRRLYEEAEASLEEDPKNQAIAKDLLDQALRESPGNVEAAALFYALNRRVPEKTVETLWNDGPRLFALYQECAGVDPALPRAVLERWLNRSIDLGHVVGRLTRALNQKKQGNPAAAELELSNYLALVTSREDVDAVKLLRAELSEKPRPSLGLGREAILNARLRLRSGDLEGALRLLDAPCRAGLDPERLFWLGIVYERQQQHERALECYELELVQQHASPTRPSIERRMARLLARAEPQLLSTPSAARLPELASREAAALWAMARRAADTGRSADATGYVARYLAQANPEDRFVPEAKLMRQRLLVTDQLKRAEQLRMRRILLGSGATLLGLLGTVAYFWLFRGATVARAIRRRPRIYPKLASIVGELRHDVLKHRTSALELLAQSPSALAKIRSTMLEPIPTSVVVAEAYSRLAVVARAEGIQLRRLSREPVFGSLARDLRSAERALTDPADFKTIQWIESRLRTVHRERLQQLMSIGPRSLLDASEIQAWIAALQAEITGRAQPWTIPALQMSDLNLAFPVDRASLLQIFANLMRNAQAASSSVSSPRVLVRLLRDTDFAGRTWVKLQIGDNAEGELSEELLEAQASDRGLGIVRDTARDWRGHVVIAREVEPYRKTVGVEFAL